jgi:hypothetical protein
MSFSTTNPTVQYSGNDVTTIFAFNHKYYADGDIVVSLENAAGAHTVQTITTHYTLAGKVTNPSDTTTCTVTMVTAPATNETLTIWRKQDFIQSLVLNPNTAYHNIPLEIQLDKLTMMNQYLQLQSDKAVKYNLATTDTPLTGEEMQALGEGVLDGAFFWELGNGIDVVGTGTYCKVRAMPYAGTIEAVRLYADQSGSVVVDIWKDTYANYPPTVADTITAAAKPTLSAAQKYEDATLTGWTTTFSKGDVFIINIDSSATITELTIEVKILKAGS